MKLDYIPLKRVVIEEELESKSSLSERNTDIF
jgi:hypothetical protein